MQPHDHQNSYMPAAVSITTGELRRIGWARIRGTGVPQEPTEKDSEMIAQAHVVDLLSSQGWKVADVHTEGRGYDVHARKGRDQRCVEVKGANAHVSVCPRAQ